MHWEVFGLSGKFLDSLENFRTIWKVSGLSGKFWIVWKVSGESGQFPDSLEIFRMVLKFFSDSLESLRIVWIFLRRSEKCLDSLENDSCTFFCRENGFTHIVFVTKRFLRFFCHENYTLCLETLCALKFAIRKVQTFLASGIYHLSLY